MKERLTELIELFHQAVDVVELISGNRAFRKYSWLFKAPIRNVAGNYRGIVISSRWKTVFEISGRVGKVVSGTLLLAQFAQNIARSRAQMEVVCMSRDPWSVKSSKLCCQASAILFKTAAQGTVAGVRTALSLSKEARFLALLGAGGNLTRPTTASTAIDFFYGRLDTFADQFCDGDQLYTHIQLRLLD